MQRIQDSIGTEYIFSSFIFLCLRMIQTHYWSVSLLLLRCCREWPQVVSTLLSWHWFKLWWAFLSYRKLFVILHLNKRFLACGCLEIVCRFQSFAETYTSLKVCPLYFRRGGGGCTQNKTPFTRTKKIGTARQIFGTALTILRHGSPNFQRVSGSVTNVMWHQCSRF